MRLSRRIGVHAPTAGGLAKTALPYLDATGASAVQIFVSNPRGWALSAGDPGQDAAFIDGCARRDVPVYVHATLLVNLGSPVPDVVANSVASLRHGLGRSAALGARGLVFHAGSAVDSRATPAALDQVRRALLPLLDEAAGTGVTRLLVEPSAGGGRGLAARVEDLESYFEAVDWHPALGVCFDTCHAWAAGHDLATPGGMTATLDTLIATVGEGRLALIHANDSRDPLGSARDRHETIGTGTIGLAPFAELLAHPATAEAPLIVETPTVKHEGHAADVATLCGLLPTAAPRTARTSKAAPGAKAAPAAKPAVAVRSRARR
jgi:deoxyribonuclease-4